MGFISEFKEFAMKGNVLDMAVGVIIGGAFGKIVSSLVDDILMPCVGMITGNVDFTSLAFQIGEGEGAAVLKYGQFIQNVVDFLIVAFCIFRPHPGGTAGRDSRPAEDEVSQEIHIIYI